jgi:hypothetical protein
MWKACSSDEGLAWQLPMPILYIHTASLTRAFVCSKSVRRRGRSALSRAKPVAEQKVGV